MRNEELKQGGQPAVAAGRGELADALLTGARTRLIRDLASLRAAIVEGTEMIHPWAWEAPGPGGILASHGVCDSACLVVQHLLELRGWDAHIMENSDLDGSGGAWYHRIVVVQAAGAAFVVDAAYRQFQDECVFRPGAACALPHEPVLLEQGEVPGFVTALCGAITALREGSLMRRLVGLEGLEHFFLRVWDPRYHHDLEGPTSSISRHMAAYKERSCYRRAGRHLAGRLCGSAGLAPNQERLARS